VRRIGLVHALLVVGRDGGRAVRAQQRRAEISGVNRTSYAGAYWGAGFHEDGLVSGYQAAADLERQVEQREPLVRCA